jgi:hypothetical protein
MKDKTKEYIREEKIYIESDGERGDKTLKCSSCGMDNFVHSSSCELEINKFILDGKNEITSELDSQPLITSFKSLKIGDGVYSRKYGFGKFAAIYLDDIIVDFDGRKIRIPAKESDLSLVPDKLDIRSKSELNSMKRKVG